VQSLRALTTGFGGYRAFNGQRRQRGKRGNNGLNYCQAQMRGQSCPVRTVFSRTSDISSFCFTSVRVSRSCVRYVRQIEAVGITYHAVHPCLKKSARELELPASAVLYLPTYHHARTLLIRLTLTLRISSNSESSSLEFPVWNFNKSTAGATQTTRPKNQLCEIWGYLRLVVEEAKTSLACE
jgi:hypothetical protein